MVVAENRNAVGHIVVDRLHCLLGRVDAAVRPGIEIVVAAELRSPGRIVQPVEVRVLTQYLTNTW